MTKKVTKEEIEKYKKALESLCKLNGCNDLALKFHYIDEDGKEYLAKLDNKGLELKELNEEIE